MVVLTSKPSNSDDNGWNRLGLKSEFLQRLSARYSATSWNAPKAFCLNQLRQNQAKAYAKTTLQTKLARSGRLGGQRASLATPTGESATEAERVAKELAWPHPRS